MPGWSEGPGPESRDSGFDASHRPGMTRLRKCRLHPRRLGLPDRLPDFQRRQRGVEILDAELAERIDHAIGDAGRPADRAGFAATLGAQRIGAAGCGVVDRHLDRRNVVGARHAVILIARGQQLSFGVVGHALIQRLSDALRDAAVHLPRHQHRIDGNADVVDRGVANDLADAGLRIDFDFADMRAVRPARPVDLAFAIDAQPRAFFVPGDIEQTDPLVGADHREHAIAILDVPTEASSMCDAFSRALAIRSLVDTATAVPPTNSEREPTLPNPVARSVSPWTISILSMEMPSDPAIICE